MALFLFRQHLLQRCFIILQNVVFTIFCIMYLSSCGDENYVDREHPQQKEETLPEIHTPRTMLTESEIAQLLLEAGFSYHQLATMICIAKYESAFRTDAIGRVKRGPAKGSSDIGLFQINTFYWLRSKSSGGCGVQENELFDAKTNARCARIVYLRHGYEGWVAYKKNRRVCENYVAKFSQSSLLIKFAKN